LGNTRSGTTYLQIAEDAEAQLCILLGRRGLRVPCCGQAQPQQFGEHLNLVLLYRMQVAVGDGIVSRGE
jgi:hypothetical protein